MEAEIWVEKYRPKTLDEVVGQDEVIKRLKSYVQKKNIPHLLFAGPPGTGKTATAIALARDLFGENWRDNFIEMNASVTPDTPILIRINGVIKRTTFEEIDRLFFKDEKEEYVIPIGLETLSFYDDVGFYPVSFIARHRADRIVRIKFEGGEVKTTSDHSIMVLDEEGKIVSKRADELKKGDFLLSFKKCLKGSELSIDMLEYLQSYDNPKLRTVLTEFPINEQTSWIMGLFLAEGCLSFRDGTSGQVIFTVSARDQEVIDRIRDFGNAFGISTYTQPAYSGFDRSKASAIHAKLLNTQLARFFRDIFSGHTAKSKRVPDIIFNTTLQNRLSFLMGYMGDGCGTWGKYVRYTSVSKEILTDIAWLGRISGLETSMFDREVRIVWNSFSYVRSELLPVKPFERFFKRIDGKIDVNWKYLLRHQPYDGKRRVKKATLLKILKAVRTEELDEEERKTYLRLKALAESSLYAVEIKEIEKISYDGWVYDFSVPNAEVFFGGTTPVLLHNSDERGIDVVRHKIKEFARTAPIGGAPFKIIFLDEADALTADAQAALRRTMEMYSKTCRFILSCNYVSRIIEPIQSRCAVFKFKPVPPEAMKKRLLEIAEKEGIKITEDGLEALIYIANGDFRKAINALQGAAAFGEVIDAEAIYQITATARPEEIKKLLETALEGKFMDARQMLDRMMVEYGMSGEDVVSQLFREIIASKIDEKTKVMLIDRLGEIDFRLTEGAHDRIQLDAYLAYLATVGKRKRET